MLIYQIFEANLSELIEMELSNDYTDDYISGWYNRVMIAYFTNDVLKLDQLKLEVPTSSEKDSLNLILFLRKIIREGSISETLLSDLTKNLPSPSRVWAGELFFCLGMAYSFTANTTESKKYYRAAFQAYTKIGCHKKAVKSMLNYIVAESKISPHKSYIPEYQVLAAKALAAKELGVAGVCYLNISQEYEIFKAYDAALEECEKALNLISPELGGTHHSFVRLQRAHLLWLVGRVTESKMELDKVKPESHKEVSAALLVLNTLCSKQEGPLDESITQYLTPPWKEKLDRYYADRKTSTSTKDYKLTDNENKFLKFLSAGDKTKFEIIEFLYGNKISIEASENRFRVFLYRLRQKKTDLILVKNEHYSLNVSAIPELEYLLKHSS